MGYRIKEIREAKRITQEDLAMRSGVSRATISSLENGEQKNTSTKTLLAIANALGVSIEDIFFAKTV